MCVYHQTSQSYGTLIWRTCWRANVLPASTTCLGTTCIQPTGSLHIPLHHAQGPLTLGENVVATPEDDEISPIIQAVNFNGVDTYIVPDAKMKLEWCNTNSSISNHNRQHIIIL